MEDATLIDAANHLLWIIGRMANRLHNATSPASIGEQKGDAANLINECQPLRDRLQALNVYRPDGQCDGVTIKITSAPRRLKGVE